MNRIKVYSTIKESSLAAAELFVEQVCQAVKERGQCHVSLAGGETPRRAYELLATKPYCENLPWEKIHVYWGDERCVAATHHLSNQYMARQSFLNQVGIPEENIHPITYEDSASKTAEKYEILLRSIFGHELPRFDLVLLGVGNDGHTASLFPNTDVLNVQEEWVSAVYLPEQNIYRISLTAPIINHARNIVFLVSGASKAQVLQEVVEGTKDVKRLPAQLIEPVDGDLYWLLDEDVATLLASVDNKK